jgi:DNA-directed RNA polymerase I, II, and III subunit RPABC3
MAGVLFEDIFNVKDIDPEGKKFDRGKSIQHLINPNSFSPLLLRLCCFESEKILLLTGPKACGLVF